MRITFARLAVIALACTSSVTLPGGAQADAVSAFYANKQIRLIVGFPPGGGYDISARLVTSFMSRFIPGNPTIVVQNMPGAGSIVALQYLLTQAPRDGTILGTISQYAPFDQIANDLTGQYDTRNLNWIGNPEEVNAVMPVRAASGINSIEDAKKKEVIMGAGGVQDASVFNLRVLNNIVGTKFKIIAGYNGTAEQRLAMERGEIDGRGSDSWTNLKATAGDMLAAKKINIILQFGYEREKDLPDVPLLIDLARNQAERQVFEMMSSNARIGQPIVSTPDVPADRLEALRTAFEAVMKDPRFLAAAKQQKLDVNPVPGKLVAEAVEKTVEAPQEAIKLFKAAIAEGKTFNCAEVAMDKSLCAKPEK
ncbi:MAG TPA: tripartite tricarboxylate transporter substrate-binding protein [Beijerinckiaceae bacterium]|jgi:tripartite-type tricarboxylate transporter receptor subunit TctC|nr:tripartite tricarboxylate transporter substrate-binding protein [Beijerinckiaceae bacterium]